MLSPIAAEPLPVLQTLRAAADVLMVDEEHGFCASVLVTPGHVAVARLAQSLADSPHEGKVLREVMLTTTGAFGHGYFVWHLTE